MKEPNGTPQEIEERCKIVLSYLFPYYKEDMNARQYENAMEALRSIAYGVPEGKEYKAKIRPR